MKHRTQSTLAQRIPVPARRRKLGPVGTMALLLALIVAVVAMLTIAFAPKAGATETPTPVSTTQTGGGAHKVWVCHHTGSDSNPTVLLHIAAKGADGDGQNDHTQHPGDVIEGRDGDAATVKAACADTPTDTTSTTPSGTTTTTTTTTPYTPPSTTTGTHTKNPVPVKPRHTVTPTGGVKAPVVVKPRHTRATTTPPVAAPAPVIDRPELAMTGPITPAVLWAGIAALLTGLSLTLLARRIATDATTTTRRH